MKHNSTKFGETVYFPQVSDILKEEVKRGYYLDPKTSSQDDIQKFIRANEYNLFIMLNSWVNLSVSLLGERSFVLIRTSIQFKGIHDTIGECAGLADAFFTTGSYPVTEGSWISLLVQLGKNDRDVLQVLLYPKHFSVERAPVLLENSLESFRRFNKTRKTLERNPLSYDRSILIRFKEYFSLLLEDLNLDNLEEDYGFTGGTIISPWDQVGDINRSPFHKVAALLFELGDLTTPNPTNSIDAIQILPVPKSYKTYRIIGRNSQLRNCHAVAIRRRIEACSRVHYLIKEKRFVSLYDSELNYDDAVLGSLSGLIATLDLTSASDSYTWTILSSILPNDLVREMRKCVSPACVIDGVVQPLYVAMPMGIPFVQLIQSLFYHVAKLVAIDLDCFGWTHPSLEEMILGEDIGVDYIGHVHGDDITCSPELVPSLIAVLKRCRFIVNEEKSFWDQDPESLFRESCGSLGVKGWDCSVVYYPRVVLKQSKDSLETMVSLERRLWPISEETGIFLISEVTKLQPGFTTSKTSDNEDLIWYWDLNHAIRPTKRSFIKVDKLFDRALATDSDLLRISLKLSGLPYTTVREILDNIEKYRKGVKPHTNRETPSSTDKELSRLVAKLAKHSLSFELEELDQFPMEATTRPYSIKSKAPMEFAKSFSSEIQEILLYELYLLDGPRYEDPLCQLVGCSTSRRPDFLSGGLAQKGWKKS